MWYEHPYEHLLVLSNLNFAIIASYFHLNYTDAFLSPSLFIVLFLSLSNTDKHFFWHFITMQFHPLTCFLPAFQSLKKALEVAENMLKTFFH